jgi:hypothetical protein
MTLAKSDDLTCNRTPRVRYYSNKKFDAESITKEILNGPSEMIKLAAIDIDGKFANFTNNHSDFKMSRCVCAFLKFN